MSPPLLILGNANVDLVMGEIPSWPAVGTEIMVPRSEMRPGGSAGNTALALTGMGAAHLFIAAVGDDMFGEWLARGFDPASTEWIGMRCPTTVTVGIVHQGGDRAFFTSPGHLNEARAEDLLERIPLAPTQRSFALISGSFLMPHIAAGTSELLRVLKQHGWQTAVDPGWPVEGWTGETRSLCGDWLAQADYAFLNSDEICGLAGIADLDAALATLETTGRERTLVVKRGSDGALAINSRSSVAAEAPKVKVIDTVGAGDTFNAAFLASLCRGGDLQSALESGVASASLAISTFPRRYSPLDGKTDRNHGSHR